MYIIRDLGSIPDAAKNAVVAIGNFDGVHLGHRAILSHALALARQSGGPAAALTFEPHPREFFNGFRERLRIVPFRIKAMLLAELGMDWLFVVRFNAPFARMTAATFTHDLLHRQLQVSHVVTGDNFFFGHQRAGHQLSLADAAQELGYGYSAHPPVQDGQGQAVSSSAIRHALTLGETDVASALLGRPYTIEGHVRHGDKRGRTLGFPTLNLSLGHLFVARHGVYAARVQVGDRWHDAVASIGSKPTFGGAAPLLEAHLFDFNQTCYGERVRVQLLNLIRAEQTFATAEALTQQMGEDARQAKRLLDNHI